MRVLSSVCGSRGGGVAPLVGLAVRLRALGAEVRVCAPQDYAERLAEVGVPLVPVGGPSWCGRTVATSRPAADLPRRAAEMIAAQFNTVAAAAEGCDALVATGMFPAPAGARSVAGDLTRQRPRGHIRRRVARRGRQVARAGPGALMRRMAGRDLRSELMW